MLIEGGNESVFRNICQDLRREGRGRKGVLIGCVERVC